MWSPKWRREGSDPDYRFSLANERTFLAWVRTSMALLAGGVVLEQFADRLGSRSVLTGLASALAVLSAVLCGAAYRHWRANEIAMRHGHALPASFAIPLLAGMGLLASTVIAVLVIMR